MSCSCWAFRTSRTLQAQKQAECGNRVGQHRLPQSSTQLHHVIIDRPCYQLSVLYRRSCFKNGQASSDFVKSAALPGTGKSETCRPMLVLDLTDYVVNQEPRGIQTNPHFQKSTARCQATPFCFAIFKTVWNSRKSAITRASSAYFSASSIKPLTVFRPSSAENHR